MKLFAIRDEDRTIANDIAYLIYFEQAKRFYIELPDDADVWETPLLLSSFAKRHDVTVDSYWSKLWVQQRIIPPDRQNLGQILRDNGLKEYDEFSLLMLGNGRCANDSYYLDPIKDDQLPASIQKRSTMRVEEVVPSADKSVIIFFRDGATKRCDIEKICKDRQNFKPVLNSEVFFRTVTLQPDGYGICWGQELNIDYRTLYKSGTKTALTYHDMENVVRYCTVDSGEAADLLFCTRQNISDLVKRGKLMPVKTDGKSALFLRRDILQRLW